MALHAKICVWGLDDNLPGDSILKLLQRFWEANSVYTCTSRSIVLSPELILGPHILDHGQIVPNPHTLLCNQCIRLQSKHQEALVYVSGVFQFEGLFPRVPKEEMTKH